MTQTVLFTAEPMAAIDAAPALVIRIDQPDDDRRVIAAAQALLGVEGPVILAGHGVMGRLLPRLAFARRASRRPIAGYLLIDCDLPAVAGDWPDAPVSFMATTPAFQTHAKVAAERGWTVVSSSWQ